MPYDIHRRARVGFAPQSLTEEGITMKMIYEAPQLDSRLLNAQDVMTASNAVTSSETTSADKDNTYLENYGVFGYSVSSN